MHPMGATPEIAPPQGQAHRTFVIMVTNNSLQTLPPSTEDMMVGFRSSLKFSVQCLRISPGPQVRVNSSPSRLTAAWAKPWPRHIDCVYYELAFFFFPCAVMDYYHHYITICPLQLSEKIAPKLELFFRFFWDPHLIWLSRAVDAS